MQQLEFLDFYNSLFGYATKLYFSIESPTTWALTQTHRMQDKKKV